MACAENYLSEVNTAYPSCLCVAHSNTNSESSPTPPLATSGSESWPLPLETRLLEAIMPTYPATHREESTGGEASEATGSGSSIPSDELEWTHCEQICAVFHEDGCNICEKWRLHCAPIPVLFSNIVDDFKLARDEALRLKQARYAQELEETNKEIEAATRELNEVIMEIKRVQQPEGRQTKADNQSPAYRPPPSTGKPSSRPHKRPHPTPTLTQHPHCPTILEVDSESEGDQAPASASSCPRKRLRTIPTPTQHPRLPTIPSPDVIWVDSESEGEHAPAPAPVTSFSAATSQMPSDG